MKRTPDVTASAAPVTYPAILQRRSDSHALARSTQSACERVWPGLWIPFMFTHEPLNSLRFDLAARFRASPAPAAMIAPPPATHARVRNVDVEPREASSRPAPWSTTTAAGVSGVTV